MWGRHMTLWKYDMRELNDFRLKGRMSIFIDDFLKDRNFQLQLGDNQSSQKGQEMSVPQRSILLCYLIYK